MRDKKKTLTVVLIVVIISTFLIGYGYFSFKRENASKNLPTAELPIPQLSFQNSLPVGTIVKLPKLISISGRTIPDNTKRVFVFVSRTCGSCECISIAIPNRAKTCDKLTWIYIEKSDEPPIYR